MLQKVLASTFLIVSLTLAWNQAPIGWVVLASILCVRCIWNPESTVRVKIPDMYKGCQMKLSTGNHYVYTPQVVKSSLGDYTIFDEGTTIYSARSELRVERKSKGTFYVLDRRGKQVYPGNGA